MTEITEGPWVRAEREHAETHPNHVTKSDPTYNGYRYCSQSGQPAGVRGCGRYLTS